MHQIVGVRSFTKKKSKVVNGVKVVEYSARHFSNGRRAVLQGPNMRTILKLVGCVVVLFLAYLFKKWTDYPDLPKLEEVWWGQDMPNNDTQPILPFKIHISDEVSVIYIFC